MKNCIRIPRILLPRTEERYWSVVACDENPSDRAFWEQLSAEVGDRPSTLRFVLPEAYLGEEDEERMQEIFLSMRNAMCDEWMYKLDRGMILVERTCRSGVRRGILTCIDLEDYAYESGVNATVRSSQAVDKASLAVRTAIRRGATLEFPHALVCYKDKKDKIMRELMEEELEQLYDFDLLSGGGRLTGYFIPEYIAEDVANELHTRTQPCFAVADGNCSLAAAKTYWEELKGTLSERERRTHPARFALVEFVNLYDSAVTFHPVHRLIKGVDVAAFCDYFTKKVKCKRKENVLMPALAGGRVAVEKTDEIIRQYLHANAGTVEYVLGEERLRELSQREDCVGIFLAAMEKEDLFAQLKGAKNLPKKTFSVGEATEKRYYMEGREISYD